MKKAYSPYITDENGKTIYEILPIQELPALLQETADMLEIFLEKLKLAQATAETPIPRDESSQMTEADSKSKK